MIPVDQTTIHDPENGKIGDCFSAVLASLLHMPIDKIPLFAAKESWLEDLNAWLRPFNLCFLTISGGADWLESLGVKGLYHDLAGVSPRNPDWNHATVGLDGEMIHDPHPDKAGIGKFESIGVFVLLEPWQALK